MKIFAYAKNRSKIFDDLEDKSEEVFEHVLKVLMYPGHEAENHWVKEIYANLHKVSKLSSSNKFPKYADIMKHTWYIHEDMLRETVSALVIDYGATDQADTHLLYTACYDYFQWISKELSNRGVISKTEISDELDAIIEAYNFT